MNVSVIPCILLLVLVVCCARAQESAGEFYDSRYDYLDVDAILENKRLVRNYVDCLLNQRPCTPEGKALKRILPEGLRTKCARCSPRQKHSALIVLRRLQETYPAEWARLKARWDPTGDFTRRFQGLMEKDDNNKIDEPIRPASSSPQPMVQVQTRFGAEEGGQSAGSEIQPTVRAPPALALAPAPVTQRPALMTTTFQMPTIKTQPTTRQILVQSTFRPVQSTMQAVASTVRPILSTYRPRPKPSTVRYPEVKPVVFTPIYTGTMGLIDHFGSKIIRTTNIVTDLLKNTVRAVVGRK